MENNTVFVRSASDCTVIINVPHLPLRRVWQKRGARHSFDRNQLIQAFYDPSVEYLFRNGKLITDDEEFMIAVGLKEEGGEVLVYELTDALKNRMIKLMPLAEVKKEMEKLTPAQIEELVEYAIVHYQDLAMDRIDLFSNATGRNVMGAIKNYKLSQED